jgi:hypothetical protein
MFLRQARNFGHTRRWFGVPGSNRVSHPLPRFRPTRRLGGT